MVDTSENMSRKGTILSVLFFVLFFVVMMGGLTWVAITDYRSDQVYLREHRVAVGEALYGNCKEDHRSIGSDRKAFTDRIELELLRLIEVEDKLYSVEKVKCGNDWFLVEQPESGTVPSSVFANIIR